MVARLLHVWLNTSMHKWWQSCYIYALIRAWKNGGKVAACLIGYQHATMEARLLHIWSDVSMQLWWQGWCMSGWIPVCINGGKVDKFMLGYEHENVVERLLHVWSVISMQLSSWLSDQMSACNYGGNVDACLFG